MVHTRPTGGKETGRVGGRDRMQWRVTGRRLACAIAAASISGALMGVRPAQAATPLTVSVTAAPSPVSDGQDLTYTITVNETAGMPATNLSLSDALQDLNGLGNSGYTITASSGSCTQSSGQVSCSDALLAANGTWTVTVEGQVSAAVGTTLNDTAALTGMDGSTSVSTSGSASTLVDLAAGFAQKTLLGGLHNPTCFAFAPNGDIYIAQQGGAILIDRGGKLLATPVVTVSTDGSNELGVLGLALDPNFASNGYMYLSYTTTSDLARVSRFTVQNGVANPSSEVVYYTGNQLQSSGHHSANDLHVGPDGKLWWSVGDAVPAISNAQTLANINGKILRFNLDGSVPSDNPFIHVPGAVPYIYAYGLRNPFRFTFLPTGQAMTEDTGSSYWEEMDTVQAGGNYGWDFYEGNCFSCGYINPAYAYGHLPVDGAISAISSYSGSVFPQQYDHVVFFGDYNRTDIEAVAFDPTYRTETSETEFDAAAGTIADLQEGPDGDLYYVSIFEGTFTKVYPVGPFPPSAAATASPNAGSAPLTVQFSSAGSSDPYGHSLTYSWNFGDGSATNTTASPSHAYAANGTYTATLTVSNGAQTGSASTTVVVGQTPPSATMTQPAAGTMYNGGQTINFSGTATDARDGTEPASAFTWQADFYQNGVAVPFYLSEVPHPFYGPATGISSGTLQIPNDLSQTPASFYRITMTVTDSLGLSTVVTRDIHPNLTSWTATSNVSGAAFVVDGTWHTAAYTTQDVVGVQHVLTGVPLQTVSSARYRFLGWADGSALTDSFTTTGSSTTYTADYDPSSTTLPSAWQTTDVGSPLTPGGADYSSSSGSFYVDGAGNDVSGSTNQSRLVYQTLNGDGTIVARIRYETNTHSWAKAGLMILQSTASGAPYVSLFVTPDVNPSTPNVNGVNCVLQDPGAGCDAPLPPVTPAVGNGLHLWKYTAGLTNTGSGAQAGTPPAFPNKWLKLQRTGNTFSAWYSSDGVSWTSEGTTTFAMNKPALIGLFVTSHNNGQVSTAAFDNVQVTTPSTGPLPSPWVDQDVGSPAVAGSASYANGVFTVNGAGIDIWQTHDQFNYVSQADPGDATIVARVTSQSASDPNAKAGVMFKQSTAAGSNYILIAVGPGYVKVQYDFNNSINVGSFTLPNAWVKLVRSGSTFTAYTSTDGSTWTSQLSIALPITGAATAGIFVCSHNANVLGTATFDNVSFTSQNQNSLPSPWVDQDVGSPALAGSAGYSGGTFTVNGGGVDIWHTHDQFNYVSQPDPGDATIIARVTSQTQSDPNAKAGVIFKQSTTSGSNYMLIAVGPGYIKIQWDYYNSVNVGSYTFPDAWVKLVRAGSVFTAYTSADGATWTQQVSMTLPISGAATAGLFVCSHNSAVLGTATFDHVSFTTP